LQRLSLGRVTLRSYRATAAIQIQIQLQPNSKVRVSRSTSGFRFSVHTTIDLRPPCPISIANNPVGELKMPTLQNPRHEKFAQELAAGKSAAEAYAHCGYKPNYGNCIRLKGFKGSRLAWQSYNTVALLALR
jgi:hypothetical protein